MIQRISSLTHPLVKHLVKLRKESNYRYQSNSLLFNGEKPILELTSYIKRVIYSESYSKSMDLKRESYVVTEAIMQKISGLVSPEGIVAEMELPILNSLTHCSRLLVLDAVSDPGNVGTLLRTALAFEWDAIFMLPGSCDLFNEKVVRAARGAHFKVSLCQGGLSELKEIIKNFQLSPLVANLHGSEPHLLPKLEKKALVLGNEARGPCPEILEFCTPVTLKMSSEVQSLNVAVAGAILLYTLNHL